MESTLWTITKHTPKFQSEANMPFYQFLFKIDAKMVTLYHQFTYHADTFDRSELDEFIQKAAEIELLFGQATKVEVSEQYGKSETYYFR